MTPKENLLAMYSHKKIDIMPMPFEDEFSVYPVNGFTERPPFNKGGRDWFGCLWEYSEAAQAASPDVHEHLLEDICDWREIVKFPDLDAWNWEEAVRLDHLDQADRKNQVVNVMMLNGMFERLHVLMGFENALCALLTDPEEVAAFFDEMVVFKCKLLDKIKEYYNPDIVTFHDDWGTQRGPFMSPDTWRELIKPRIQKIVDHCHQLGILFLMHSCGKYDQLIPDIAEMKIDVLQCMDIMDIGKAIEIADGRMTIQASVHTQIYEADDKSGILTEEAVREQVRREFTEWGKSGKYYPFVLPPSTWYEKIIREEYDKVRHQLAGSYTK